MIKLHEEYILECENKMPKLARLYYYQNLGLKLIAEKLNIEDFNAWIIDMSVSVAAEQDSYKEHNNNLRFPGTSDCISCNKEEVSIGLGDTIAKITHTTGLDKLSELYTKITGKDCGCASRQEALNKLIPYKVQQ